MLLSFTLAEKGAPPFVRYLPIFPLSFRLRELCGFCALCVNSVSFFRLSTFNLQPANIQTLPRWLLRFHIVCRPPPFKSFSCTTYASSRKCCKQKTYDTAKLFRCNLQKTRGAGRCLLAFLLPYLITSLLPYLIISLLPYLTIVAVPPDHCSTVPGALASLRT